MTIRPPRLSYYNVLFNSFFFSQSAFRRSTGLASGIIPVDANPHASVPTSGLRRRIRLVERGTRIKYYLSKFDCAFNQLIINRVNLLSSSPLSVESESAKSKFWLTAHFQAYSRHHNITSKEVFPKNFTLANTAITARALLDFLDEYRVSVTFLTLVNCWIFLEESLASLTFLTLVIFFWKSLWHL